MTTLSPLFTWRSAIADREFGARPGAGSGVGIGTLRHVALTLSLHMSELGDSCYPGLVRLALETGLAKSTVTTALKELEAEGWVKRKVGGGKGNTTRYTAAVPLSVREAYRKRQETDRLTDPNWSGAEQEDVKRTSVRKTTSSSSAAAKKKDLVWDALAATLFVPHTQPEKDRIGKTARLLRDAVKEEFGDMNGALDRKCADEIVRRMANYPPDWTKRTPEALVKHWTDLGAGGDGADRARVADRLRRMAEHDAGKGVA